MDAFIKKISDGIKTELEDVNLPTKEVRMRKSWLCIG
jgi:hypothetical protein